MATAHTRNRNGRDAQDALLTMTLWQTQCSVTSGDLALGLGGVFRICLADDAIATVRLAA